MKKQQLKTTPCNLADAFKRYTDLTATLEGFLNGNADAVRVEWRGRYVSPISCANALKVRAKNLRLNKSVIITTAGACVYLVKASATNGANA
jgi:hypothetical protein